MKRMFIFLLLLVFITGCSIEKYDNDFNISIETLIKQKHNLHNMAGLGYKYYLPRGVRQENSTEYNKILYSSGKLYYLYVDVISYYYKVSKPYEVDEKAYYSKPLKYGDNEGYIEINKINNKYLVEMMYNYAKVEAYITYDSLDKVITDFCYILTSVKFNDDIIETLIGKKILDFNEEKFDIFEPVKQEKNFLDYVQKFDNPNDKEKIRDNDIIDLDKIIDF